MLTEKIEQILKDILDNSITIAISIIEKMEKQELKEEVENSIIDYFNEIIEEVKNSEKLKDLEKTIMKNEDSLKIFVEKFCEYPENHLKIYEPKKSIEAKVKENDLKGLTVEEQKILNSSVSGTLAYIEEELTGSQYEKLKNYLPQKYRQNIIILKSSKRNEDTYNFILKHGFDEVSVGNGILGTGINKYIKEYPIKDLQNYKEE